MTAIAAGSLTYEFKADLSDLKKGMADLKATFAQSQQAAQQAGQQIAQGLQQAATASQSLGTQVTQTRTILGSFARGFVIGAVVEGFRQLIILAKDYAGELVKTGDVAKRTYQSVQQLSGTLSAARAAGVNTAKALDDVNALGAKANTEFREGEGDLTDLLKANNLSLTDRNGKLRSTNDLLLDAARLVQNAGSEFDKIDIARIFGLSEDWVRVLEKGPDALAKSQAEAQALGGTLDADLVQRATDFDRNWQQAWESFTLHAKSAILSAAEGLRSLADQANEFITKMMLKLPLPEATRKQYEQLLPQQEAATAADQGSSSPMELTITPKRRTNATVIPTKKSGGGGGGSDIDQIQRYIDSLQKARDILKVEVDTWGQGNTARQTAINLINLDNVAKRAGVTVTEEQKQKVRDVTAAYEDQKKKLEDLHTIQESLNQVANTFANALDSWIVQGNKFKDVLAQLLRQLASMALRSALMGNDSGGKTGGLFGAIFSGLGMPKFATGGQVGGNSWAIVGENGPELIRSGQQGATVTANGAMGGNGGQSVVIHQTFTADANPRELASIAAKIKQETMLGVRQAMARGAF